jgi:hypothetical protein
MGKTERRGAGEKRRNKKEKANEREARLEKEQGSASENRRAATESRGRLESMELTNAELKRMLDAALVRFGNWKVQMEMNPNPRLVHNLKNIVSIIDTLSRVSEKKISYSYKDLSLEMSYLIDEVARLNRLITSSLMEDDAIDEDEAERINAQMMTVIQRTVELIRLVQQSFGTRRLLESGVGPKQIEDGPEADRG